MRPIIHPAVIPRPMPFSTMPRLVWGCPPIQDRRTKNRAQYPRKYDAAAIAAVASTKDA